MHAKCVDDCVISTKMDEHLKLLLEMLRFQIDLKSIGFFSTL